MPATASTIIGGQGRLGPQVFSGAAAPTVDNDAAQGVRVGDLFVDTTAAKAYVCLANTAGAASWQIASVAPVGVPVGFDLAALAAALEAAGVIRIIAPDATVTAVYRPASGETTMLAWVFDTEVASATDHTIFTLDDGSIPVAIDEVAGDTVVVVYNQGVGNHAGWSLASQDGLTFANSANLLPASGTVPPDIAVVSVTALGQNLVAFEFDAPIAQGLNSNVFEVSGVIVQAIDEIDGNTVRLVVNGDPDRDAAWTITSMIAGADITRVAMPQTGTIVANYAVVTAVVATGANTATWYFDPPLDTFSFSEAVLSVGGQAGNGAGGGPNGEINVDYENPISVGEPWLVDTSPAGILFGGGLTHLRVPASGTVAAPE